ncbi:MAG: glycoside hydrolase family 13 protein [Oscillospiraceae bacterium]|nr:glycoside hydrolase family 13 protein [Oscillospiraceae bacterium]
MAPQTFPVYFGGKTTDQWTADSLQVLYSDRICVLAVPNPDGTYRAKSLDAPHYAAEINQCKFSLKRFYFDTYVSICQAVTRLQDGGKDIYAFPEYFDGAFSPLAMGEILRVLLDNWNIQWEPALHLISRCNFQSAQTAWNISLTEVSALQPRTAQLMELLSKAIEHDKAVSQCFEVLLSKLIIHDSSSDEFRCPIGSVPTESEIQLRLFDGTGLVERAEVIFDGDYCHKETVLNKDMSCTVTMPKTPVALRYRFRLSLRGTRKVCWLGEVFGKQYGHVSMHDCSGFRLTVYQKGFDTPAWFRRSIMYQVFPDRFATDPSDTALKGMEYHRKMGRFIDYSADWNKPVKWQPTAQENGYMPNDFYGGTFKGIESKLPYLKELGISVLYLNPIVESCSNHRYDTADYNVPDPILGTMEDFDHLVTAGKKLGIHVMLDGVFSHTGADSVYFNRYNSYKSKGAFQSKDSPYYPWYVFFEHPEKYRAWWGFESLPEVEETNANWQDFVITGKNSVVRNWLRHGTCGWRLDVADELPDSVLELIRKATKEEGEDRVVMGEVWEDAIEKESYGLKRTYALGNALDTVMNYPFRDAALNFLAGHTGAEAMTDFLLSQRLHYPKPMYYALMNLLSSHDVPRIRTMLAIAPEGMPGDRPSQVARVVSPDEDIKGAALQKLASALSFCIPGVPSVYYGDETGMNGFRDPFNRAPFHTGANPQVEWYAKLGQLRNEHPALSTGSMGVFHQGNDVVCVLRSVTNGTDAFGLEAKNDCFLLVVNRSRQSIIMEADVFAAAKGLTAVEQDALYESKFTQAVCELSGEAAELKNGHIKAEIPALGVRLYHLK